MNALELMRYWHECIDSKNHIDDYVLYLGEEVEEFIVAKKIPNKVKEAFDIVVVSEPLMIFGDMEKRILAINAFSRHVDPFFLRLGVKLSYFDFFEAGLSAVNESNFSKFIHRNDVESEIELKGKEGIACGYKVVDSNKGLCSIVSMYDQDVAGKHYKAGKILKPSTYRPVDESVNFWEV